MDDNNGEHNKIYHESINFAIQGMNENAQFSVAIAVGIFGILAIFATIDDYDDKDAQNIFGKTVLWTHPLSIQIIGIVLSIAYWALVLFGIQSYVARRVFEEVMADHLKKMNEEQYYKDIIEIAKENKLANFLK